MRTYGLRFWWPWAAGPVPGVDRDTQDAVALANLRLAADAASKVGASVLVEAINSVDVPAFPVDTSARAMAFIARAGMANVGFLADLYHLAKMGEDVADALSRYRLAIAHVRVGWLEGARS